LDKFAKETHVSNTLGLLIIGLGIAFIVGFVLFVQYMARNHPDTKLGQIAKAIDAFIDRLPED